MYVLKRVLSVPTKLRLQTRAGYSSFKNTDEEISKLTISEVNLSLEKQLISPLKLLQQCISITQRRNPDLNAFISLEDVKLMLRQAIASEIRWKSNLPKGFLDGITVALKDNFATKAANISCGSNILKDMACPYDASVVWQLHNAGAIIVGKTNLDEFAMGSSNIHSAFGPVYNPHSTPTNIPGERRVAGGSSGGSAAAVAAGMVFAAIGSDTGGSVRLPASYCGIVGFKPSYGRCSRWGLVAYANSLDTVGVLGRSVTDVEIIYDTISGYDEKDPTSIPEDLRDRIDNHFPTPQWRAGYGSLSGLRIGIPQEYYLPELQSSVISHWRRAIRYLRSRGASIVSISLPMTKHALSAYYILASAEASSNLARFDGVRYGRRKDGDVIDEGKVYANTRSEGFGTEVKRRIIMGTYVLTEGSYNNYFLRAQKIRRLVKQDFDRVFARPNPLHTFSSQYNVDTGVHAILTPSAISTAPSLRDCLEADGNAKTLDAYVNDVMTVPASLAGIPALSVPVGKCEMDGLPVGLQIVGQYGDEKIVCTVGKILEEMGQEI